MLTKHEVALHTLSLRLSGCSFASAPRGRIETIDDVTPKAPYNHGREHEPEAIQGHTGSRVNETVRKGRKTR